MAKAYKEQVKDLRVEVADLQESLMQAERNSAHFEDKYLKAEKELNAEIDKLNARINRYKAALQGQASKIARLAEEGLIEADHFSNYSKNVDNLMLLIGRLEGHLRGVINATGCEYHVKRPDSENSVEMSMAIRREQEHKNRYCRGHGFVNHSHRHDDEKKDIGL